jgi:DNA-binding HxlR family transcriptional regulator
VVTLFALSEGPLRHGELVDLIGGVSRKVLIQTQRRLQQDGLVDRQVYAEAPPRVEYSLTELGQTLKEPIVAPTTWARVNGEAVTGAHEETEAEDA